MIIPTPEFDPMFAEDGIPFRDKMIGYIRREFSDLLGADARLLDAPGGLEALSRLGAGLPLESASRKAAA